MEYVGVTTLHTLPSGQICPHAQLRDRTTHLPVHFLLVHGEGLLSICRTATEWDAALRNAAIPMDILYPAPERKKTDIRQVFYLDKARGFYLGRYTGLKLRVVLSAGRHSIAADNNNPAGYETRPTGWLFTYSRPRRSGIHTRQSQTL